MGLLTLGCVSRVETTGCYLVSEDELPAGIKELAAHIILNKLAGHFRLWMNLEGICTKLDLIRNQTIGRTIITCGVYRATTMIRDFS